MNSPQTPIWAEPEAQFVQSHIVGALPRRPQPASHSAHVLVIDAHEANLRVLQEVLEESGYAVAAASNLGDAQQMAMHRRPDLVLLDQDLCSKEGVGLIAPLLNQVGWVGVPCILLGPCPDTEQVWAALEAGCVDTIPKPVRAREVLARVAIHLRSHHLAAQARQARQALDAFGHASLVLRARDGARIWHTPLASQLMHFHFEAPDVVTPPQVLRWLRQLLNGDASVSTLISARAGRRLELSLHGQTGQTGDDEWLVVMRETSDAALIDAIAVGLKLTLREAEVLYWVVKGKINRDIAAILGLSPQTVKKHLEHIFPKLGVETRTSAATLALGRVRGLSN